jgi:uncharacterized Tic20 family protein
MTEENPVPPPPPPAAVPPPGGSPPTMAYSGPSGYPGPYAGPEPSKDDRTMGMLAHLLGIFLAFLGPLIIWLIKKDQSPFVDDQGKEALNFQLVMLIAWVVGGATACFGIGFILIFGAWICTIVFGILGAMEANKGIAYRYPFNIRMVK